MMNNYSGRRNRTLGTRGMPKVRILWAILTVVSIVVVGVSLLRKSSESLVLLQEDAEVSSRTTKTKVAEKKTLKSNPTRITRISLIGERNSGTRWTSSHLTECFAGQGIQVAHRLVRHKHWFQHDVLPDLRRHRTLVIAQFRDPIYWVDAMRRKPHHAPMHYQRDWQEFVQIPWSLPSRPPLDQQFLQQIESNNRATGTNTTSYTPPCHEYFEPHQLISCVKYPFPSKEQYKAYFMGENVALKVLPSFSGDLPRYELNNDGSGKPYNNILEMRADKIRNFLSIKDWDWIEDVRVIQYERLLSEGTATLISYIEGITGLTANCTAVPPQKNRPPKPLDPAYVQWMNHHVDWNAEKLIGYERWQEESAE